MPLPHSRRLSLASPLYSSDLFCVAHVSQYLQMRGNSQYFASIKSLTAALNAVLVDLVTEKGETGCVGCAWALVHSFLGCIICDKAYKTKCIFHNQLNKLVIVSHILWFRYTRTPCVNSRWLHTGWKDDGRLKWNMEVSMQAGCIATGVLLVVGVRCMR